MNPKKNSHRSRLPLAITLVVASFVSAFLIATVSDKGQDYWVIAQPVNSGHILLEEDLSISHINLNNSASFYLHKSENPIGMIVARNMATGALVGRLDITSQENAMSTSAVPISVRNVDLAKGLIIGEGVDIYWVQDSRNGEPIVDPILILGGVALLSYDQAGNNFGSDIGLTIAVEETQVLRILSATTQGRLVVVQSHV